MFWEHMYSCAPYRVRGYVCTYIYIDSPAFCKASREVTTATIAFIILSLCMFVHLQRARECTTNVTCGALAVCTMRMI